VTGILYISTAKHSIKQTRLKAFATILHANERDRTICSVVFIRVKNSSKDIRCVHLTECSENNTNAAGPQPPSNKVNYNKHVMYKRRNWTFIPTTHNSVLATKLSLNLSTNASYTSLSNMLNYSEQIKDNILQIRRAEVLPVCECRHQQITNHITVVCPLTTMKGQLQSQSLHNARRLETGFLLLCRIHFPTFPDKMNNFPWLISLFATPVRQYQVHKCNTKLCSIVKYCNIN